MILSSARSTAGKLPEVFALDHEVMKRKWSGVGSVELTASTDPCSTHRRLHNASMGVSREEEAIASV